ncbi:hypothetical protein ILUMI_25091 [Ignelater luminosus]|uniref:YqaJ viral recombinase domain-containing protein n=1 Tax=Ignelater luminosus TaxID=2038154 RepID=A0A8K0C7Z4_IGNLU|nr:hypothetical protein ILUMI_25091 [Ignelater luminosus]
MHNTSEVATNKRFPLDARKLLTGKGVSRIERLVKGIITAIKRSFNKNNGLDSDVLRQDLLNAPYHVFGYHKNCGETFCKKKDDDNVRHIIYKSGLLEEIQKIVDPMARNSNLLAYIQTTNEAQRFMSLVAKCAGGKRINFTKRNSYTTRPYAAALEHTCGPSWHLSVCKRSAHNSATFRIFEKRRLRQLVKGSKSKKSRYSRRKRDAGDFDYGPNCAQPDLKPAELKKCEEFLNRLGNDKQQKAYFSVVYMHSSNPFLGANPDRINNDGKGILEIKCLSPVRESKFKN